jgi:transcriptional regulator with XRE-family HTH domain
MLRLRVKEVIKERGISQGLLSRESKVPINLIRRMVNDKEYMPSSATLYKVSQYLGVHMEELLYEDDTQNVP